MPERKHYLDNSTEYFHTLHQVFYLTVSIPLILFCLVYLRQMEEGELSAEFTFGWPQLVITLGVGLSGFMAYYHYRRRFQHYLPTLPFRQRLRFFHRASWWKYGWLLLANLLPVLGLYLLHEQFFVGLYAVALILFSLNRPTVRRVADDLALEKAERSLLASGHDFDEKTS